MDAAVGLSGDGFFDNGGRQRAERVRALEDQRMLLRTLQCDVAATLHRLASDPPTHWRSESSRRYAHERAQLCDEVRQVLRTIDEAAYDVALALSVLMREE